jgi:hypothetical protein
LAANTTTPTRQVDYGFWAIVSLVVLIAIWLLLMPWVPAIASATLHRFHLRTRSFVLWAIQQPIPSMYNFANRYEVREIPPGFLNPIFESNEKRYINHFPVRILTFANTRYRYLHDGRDRWVMIDSTFRGQRIESHYHAKPRDDGGFEMILLPPADGK